MEITPTNEIYHPRRSWEMKITELTPRQKREARAFLFGRFGQTKCFFTGMPLYPHILQTGSITIHHLVPLGKPGCNLLMNLRLAYLGPNSNAGKPGKTAIQMIDRDKIAPDPTTQLRQVIDYSKGPVEMQVNADAEPTYRAMIWDQMLYNNRMTKKEAIYGMAERIGISPQTTRDYLEKMISEAGPFREIRENSIKYIVVKRGRGDPA
jgi:hypothetical protein